MDPVAKRKHDVLGAVRTLAMACNAVAEGYRFDDATAQAKIEAMRKASELLQREITGDTVSRLFIKDAKPA